MIRIAIVISLTTIFSLSVFAQTPDMLNGKCRYEAQAARDAIAEINKTISLEPTVVVLDLSTPANSPIEVYHNGPYTIKVHKGSDDYKDCSVMSVDFNPQP